MEQMYLRGNNLPTSSNKNLAAGLSSGGGRYVKESMYNHLGGSRAQWNNPGENVDLGESRRALGSGRERMKNYMAASFSRNEVISILPGYKQDCQSSNVQRPCIKLVNDMPNLQNNRKSILKNSKFDSNNSGHALPLNNTNRPQSQDKQNQALNTGFLPTWFPMEKPDSGNSGLQTPCAEQAQIPNPNMHWNNPTNPTPNEFAMQQRQQAIAYTLHFPEEQKGTYDDYSVVPPKNYINHTHNVSSHQFDNRAQNNNTTHPEQYFYRQNTHATNGNQQRQETFHQTRLEQDQYDPNTPTNNLYPNNYQQNQVQPDRWIGPLSPNQYQGAIPNCQPGQGLNHIPTKPHEHTQIHQSKSQPLLLKSHVSQTAEQRPPENLLKMEYKSQLQMQLEERRKSEEERKAAEKEQDEAAHRKIEADRLKMQLEYEEEKQRIKQKEEEKNQVRELVLKQTAEMRKKAIEDRALVMEKRRSRTTLPVEVMQDSCEDSEPVRPIMCVPDGEKKAEEPTEQHLTSKCSGFEPEVELLEEESCLAKRGKNSKDTQTQSQSQSINLLSRIQTIIKAEIGRIENLFEKERKNPNEYHPFFSN